MMQMYEIGVHWMLAACSQMNTLIRWRRLNTECYRAFCPRQWCVCVRDKAEG